MNDQQSPTLLARVGTYALAFLIGVIYGAVATVGHRQSFRIGDVEVPWGLVLALVGVFALLLGIRLVAGGRWAAAAAGAGIVGIVALLTLPGPGGSVLVAGDLVGTIWAVGPALIAVLVVAWPSLPARRTAVADGA
ncbi:histidinol dehydrogenase [Agromyces sp. NPDC057865]|uniref:histidinol dehydrogenase n=1 Tax=Agromyces sp. NPDC057865 TaxID=3346267 RepID=UPI0036727970